MKKLAINSFLAVTAMAWSAQSSSAPAQSQQLRDAARGTPAGLYRNGTQDARQALHAHAREAEPATPYSPSERGLIRSWLRSLPTPATADQPALVRGQKLEFMHLSQGRSLPRWLGQSLQSRGEAVVDVLLHGQVVRLQRPDNLVIDLV